MSKYAFLSTTFEYSGMLKKLYDTVKKYMFGIRLNTRNQFLLFVFYKHVYSIISNVSWYISYPVAFYFGLIYFSFSC